MIWIVGAGVCRGHITERAKKLVMNADIVYGSRKAIDLVREYVKEVRVLTGFDDETFRRIEEDGREKNVVVLSTGDPMVAGLGRRLRGIVEPGVSSVQVALSKLGVDLTDVAVVDAHARDVDDTDLEMLKYRHLIILADSRFNLKRLGRRRVVLLENICMENERVVEGYSDEMEVESDYTIVFVEKEDDREVKK